MSKEKENMDLTSQIEAAVAVALEKQKSEFEAQIEKAKSVIGGEAGTGGANAKSSSVHVDGPLSDFSLKVVQDDKEFKAAKIVSPFNSKHRQDMYYFYEPAYFMVNQVVARAEGTEAAMAKYGVSRKEYSTIVYALKQPVSDETVANADKAIERVYEDATAFVTRQFLLNKEKQFATALLGASKWATDWKGQASVLTDGVNTWGGTALPDAVVRNGRFQSFDGSASKPLDILDLAMETVQLRSGFRPNTIVMTRKVFSAIKKNTSVKTLKLYTSANSTTDSATIDTIAGHLDIPAANIYVLDVVEPVGSEINGTTYAITVTDDGYAAADGDPATIRTHQFIGGNGLLMMYVDKNSNGQYSATAAVCAQWTGLYPDGGELGNTVFKRYREERLSSEMIEGRTAFSYHIVAPALGIFLEDAIEGQDAA